MGAAVRMSKPCARSVRSVGQTAGKAAVAKNGGSVMWQPQKTKKMQVSQMPGRVTFFRLYSRLFLWYVKRFLLGGKQQVQKGAHGTG